jgi:hypothetical protein
MKELLEKPKIFEVGEWVYINELFTDELGTFVRHRLLRVDKRTKAGDAIYLWSNGVRYPLGQCGPPDFTEADIDDAVGLIQSVSDEPGISQIRELLAQICPLEIKPRIWAKLSKPDKDKLTIK